MKKTLAEQVQTYLNHKGDDFTPAKLAAEVAKFQRELPEGKRCKRQNIEQLLAGGFRTVRYLPALAAAMGTTVEVLHAGAIDDLLNNPDRNAGNSLFAASPPPTLSQALEVVAGLISDISPLLQANAREALLRWARGDASVIETTATLDALAKASSSLPPLSGALAETPVRKKNEA